MKEFSFKTRHSEIFIARYDKNEPPLLLKQYESDPVFSRFFEGKSLKYLLQQALKVDLLKKLDLLEPLHYLPSGKPVLNDGRFISVSHSADDVAVMISSDVAVGIDIQLYSEKPRKLLDKFASEAEKKKLEVLLKNNLPVYLWSAKEAVYKAAGIPGLSFKNDIRVIFKDRLPYEASVYVKGEVHNFRLIAGKIEDLFMVSAERIT